MSGGSNVVPFLIVAAIVIVTVIIENSRLTVSKYRVTCRSLPREFRGFRILQLSDLHGRRFGKDHEKLLAKIRPLHPDIIFITGDLIDRKERRANQKIELVKKLLKIAPVYISLGNHEVDSRSRSQPVLDEMARMGAHVLINGKERLYRGYSEIDIYGLALPSYFYKNDDGSYDNLPPVTRAEVEELCGKNDENVFSILLAHSPIPFEEYEKWGADLIFSGHIHGGIIRIPFTEKGLLSPERVFFPQFTYGIYRKFGAYMIVSRGLGKFRLFNPAEIVLVSLK